MKNEGHYRLSDLLSEIGAEKVKSLLSTFRCTADADAEYFLKSRSIVHDTNNVSKTYIMLDSKPEGAVVKGYYTLAIKCLAADENCNISRGLQKRMNVSNGIAQAYLLGQLAKADGVEKGFGKTMINLALNTFGKGRDLFGCQSVRLDCKDEPKLVEYYTSCGFEHIRKDDERGLSLMVIII